MKSCPTCRRTFDDSFTFCLVDGAILSAPYDPHATQRIPEVRSTNPATEVLNQGPVASPADLPSTIQSPMLSTIAASSVRQPKFPQSEEKSSNLLRLKPLIIKGMIGGMCVATVMILLGSIAFMAFGREGEHFGEAFGLFAWFFVFSTFVGAVVHPLVEIIRNKRR